MSRVYHHCKQALFYLFLIAYIFLLAKALLFKQVPLSRLFAADREIIRVLNLIPFKTITRFFFSTHFNIWIALMNVVGNIVLFIPLGLYLQIFKKNKKIMNCTAWIFASSLSVEVSQYVFGIGHTDIDDIILNTLGGLLGILIYRVIYLLLKDESKTRTAVTFLFCLISAFSGTCIFVLVALLGFRIKIF